MKVRIGPYLDYCGPYQLADLLRYVGVSKDRCFEVGKWLAETWLDPLCQWIYQKRKRTVVVKLDKWDSWNVDHTLALITLPLLKQLQLTKHGSGITDNADAPEHLRDPADQNMCGDLSQVHARWDYILGEIIWAFEQLVSDNKEEQFYVNDTLDVDGLTTYENRLQNGLRLYGKYYRNLWD